MKTLCMSLVALGLCALTAVAPPARADENAEKAPAELELRTTRVVIFKDTKDPDYQAILAGISKDKARLDKIKRFDMPGFRPNEHYIREMKVYGILPKSFKDKTDPIDCYKIDRAYWRSLWYHPQKTR